MVLAPLIIVARVCALLRRAMESTMKHNTILSPRRVCERLGISRATLWRISRKGSFPKPIKLSPNRVGFREDEIEAWIAARAAERELAE
jgi:prophage regulatory protein